MASFDENLAKYSAGRGAQYLPLYKAASEKYSVPYDVLVRQGAQESGFWNPDVVSGKVKSSAGAIGISQFMPATAKGYGIDPFDVEQSIDAQGKYMASNMRLFKGDVSKAVAGYNWGEGNVQRKGMDRLPKETSHYVATVMGGHAPKPSDSAGGAATPKDVDCGLSVFCWGNKAGNAAQNTVRRAVGGDVVDFADTDSGKAAIAEQEGDTFLGYWATRIAVGIAGLVVMGIGLAKLRV